MHIFLQGPSGIGKSTVIHKSIARFSKPPSVGGFITYKIEDDGIYICAANQADRRDAVCVARYDECGAKTAYPEVFNTEGVGFLKNAQNFDLICMDELGYLESKAELFMREVLACLDGGVPIIGVLRDAEIPWHAPVKSHPCVSIIRVSADNRDGLPHYLCSMLKQHIRGN